MDVSGAAISVIKPMLEVVSYGAVLFVGWLYNRITKNEETLKKHRQEFYEFKVHVAQNHATNEQVSATEQRIIREMQNGFDSVKELINAIKKN